MVRPPGWPADGVVRPPVARRASDDMPPAKAEYRLLVSCPGGPTTGRLPETGPTTGLVTPRRAGYRRSGPEIRPVTPAGDRMVRPARAGPVVLWSDLSTLPMIGPVTTLSTCSSELTCHPSCSC
jgi:hypothetical protein